MGDKPQLFMKTVNIRVFGIVQGVFFRKSAKIEADNMGVVGWVRNEGDGSVEIMASGEKEALEKYISWCKKGPPLAKVEMAEVDWLEGEEEFDSFNII